MRQPVIMISGKDPIREAGVGHTTYVRAHALAALRAGYAPHLLAVGPEAGIAESEFGVVYRIRSPVRGGPVRGGAGARLRGGAERGAECVSSAAGIGGRRIEAPPGEAVCPA